MRRIRARAPLRLGIAGGGTDLSPYCDEFGGCVLNYTIGLYAYAIVEERADWKVRFLADDIEQIDELVPQPTFPTAGPGLSLHRGVYNRFVSEFNGGRPVAVDVYTSVDAPPGSGLGSSSALVVALVKAFAEFFNIPLSDYEVAQIAFHVERVDLGQSGGKQDQYAAAFGGCNFIEFLGKDRVVVNPLRIREHHRLEFETSLVICHTGRSRISSMIIDEQKSGLKGREAGSIEAMHQIKQDATDMKLCLLRGDLDGMGDVLRRSWAAKKRTARGVSNPYIDEIYDMAIGAGALAGKISGAGGGGFMRLLTRPERRQSLMRRLNQAELNLISCHLTDTGAEAWKA